MEQEYHLAIDIGASSGKAIIGYLDKNENKLVSNVIYRFPNGYILDEEKHKIWDISNLFTQVKNTLKYAFQNYKNIKTMSIDTWGCDYVLLDKNDREILPCYSYRDERTLDIIDEVFSKLSKKDIFNITGSQFQSFNTIFQLYKDKKEGRLNKATSFLMLPEYLIFKLTGKKVHEITNASTTSLLEKDRYIYSPEIISKLDLPINLFSKIEKVGKVVGNLLPDIEKEVGGNLLVKLVASHDTASVVRYIESNLDDRSLYLSSGTWSLLGVKLDRYFINDEVFKSNFSNELGKNYIRFQKNITGLWIVQNLVKETNIDIVQAIKLARQSEINDVVIDINDDRFLSTNNMKLEILSYLKEKGYIDKFEDKDLFNIAFISLAHLYKKSIDEIEMMLNKKFDKLLVLGGGAKNEYLNSLIEKICQIKVISYPYECSALGNLLSQIED